jgi:hypothetical protein
LFTSSYIRIPLGQSRKRRFRKDRVWVENLSLVYSGLRVIYRIGVASTGPSVARGIVAAEMSERLRTRTLDDLKLLVSELVTHRVRVGRPGETITLELQADDVVRCAVTDEGPLALPAELGLTLLDRVAARWGMSRKRQRTHTWVEARPSRGPAAG